MCACNKILQRSAIITRLIFSKPFTIDTPQHRRAMCCLFVRQKSELSVIIALLYVKAWYIASRFDGTGLYWKIYDLNLNKILQVLFAQSHRRVYFNTEKRNIKWQRSFSSQTISFSRHLPRSWKLSLQTKYTPEYQVEHYHNGYNTVDQKGINIS